MESQLKLGNLTRKVDVAEVRYTEPLANGFRAFFCRLAKNPVDPLRIDGTSTLLLTLDGRDRHARYVDEDATGYYLIGAFK